MNLLELNDFGNLLIKKSFSGVDRILLASTNAEYLIAERDEQGNAHFSITMTNELFVKTANRPDTRGRFLEGILRIEYIINMLFIIHLKAYEDRKRFYILEDLLIKTPLAERINALKKNNIIDKELRKQLNDLRDIRNQLAHTLDIEKANDWRGKKNILYNTNDVEKMYIKAVSELLNVYAKGQKEYYGWVREQLIN